MFEAGFASGDEPIRVTARPTPNYRRIAVVDLGPRLSVRVKFMLNQHRAGFYGNRCLRSGDNEGFWRLKRRHAADSGRGRLSKNAGA